MKLKIFFIKVEAFYLQYKNVLLFSVLMFSILVGLFFRIYNFFERTQFYSDQASDLLIARSIIEDQHRPLIGPILSIKSFYTPPTYYYLLASFYFLTPILEGVAVWFLVFNLSAAITLFYLMRRLMGNVAATGSVVFFLLSKEMILQSRSMWQPFPVIFFLSIALLLLDISLKKKKLAWHIFSVSFHTLALSIYPSSILLIPFYIYQTFRFYRIRQNVFITSIILSVITHTLISLIFFAPLLFFEVHQDYPTFRNILTYDKSQGSELELNQSISGLSNNLIRNVTILAGLFFTHSSSDLPVSGKINYIEVFFLTPLFILFLGCVIYIYWEKDHFLKEINDKYNDFFSFINLPTLFFGFILFIFFDGGLFRHRMVAFIPFYFLVSGMLFRSVFDSVSYIYKSIIFLILSTFVVLNIWTMTALLSNPPSPDTLLLAKEKAESVLQDIKEYNYDVKEIDLKLYTPTDIWSYHSTPYVYFLHDKIDYRFDYNSNGNDLLRDETVKDRTRFIYLICHLYNTVDDEELNCLPQFKKNYPRTVQLRQGTLKSDHFYVFKVIEHVDIKQ